MLCAWTELQKLVSVQHLLFRTLFYIIMYLIGVVMFLVCVETEACVSAHHLLISRHRLQVSILSQAAVGLRMFGAAESFCLSFVLFYWTGDKWSFIRGRGNVMQSSKRQNRRCGIYLPSKSKLRRSCFSTWSRMWLQLSSFRLRVTTRFRKSGELLIGFSDTSMS